MQNTTTSTARSELEAIASSFWTDMVPHFEDGIIDPALIGLAGQMFTHGHGGYEAPSEALFGIAVEAVRLYVQALRVEDQAQGNEVAETQLALQAIGENLGLA